jgi:alpha,alpha-trehalose phosphorylase
MYLPYDERRRVHQQAAGFTRLQEWDFAGTGADEYPLVLHYPYLELYRRQVVKQADVVLAMYLRGDAFSDADKARNFAYYEARTVCDSSLSAAGQAVLAAELGHLELAHDYLAETALQDLDKPGDKSGDGLHIAACAGAWTALVMGFGGMRDHHGRLRSPHGCRVTCTGCGSASAGTTPACGSPWCRARPPTTSKAATSTCTTTANR